jgi:hypothetical protein
MRNAAKRRLPKKLAIKSLAFICTLASLAKKSQPAKAVWRSAFFYQLLFYLHSFNYQLFSYILLLPRRYYFVLLFVLLWTPRSGALQKKLAISLAFLFARHSLP